MNAHALCSDPLLVVRDDPVPREFIETPYFLTDLAVVADRLTQPQAALPNTVMLCAVKANPAVVIVGMPARSGVQFDVASRGEIDLCLGLASPLPYSSLGFHGFAPLRCIFLGSAGAGRAQ